MDDKKSHLCQLSISYQLSVLIHMHATCYQQLLAGQQGGKKLALMSYQ